VKDIGLAPNPFWDYCTLAVCTPNHMGIRAQKGDWIIGTSPKSQGSKLVYAMQISETLSFEKYFDDTRFEKKKPVVHGSWRERCGDNMYYQNEHGQWVQHRTIHHLGPEYFKKDLRHPVVFIAEYFYYFGNKAPAIPVEFQDLIRKTQGCKSNHAPELVEKFLNWLKANFSSGILGSPRDNDEVHKASCSYVKQSTNGCNQI
jgi:hypothetical protein